MDTSASIDAKRTVPSRCVTLALATPASLHIASNRPRRARAAAALLRPPAFRACFDRPASEEILHQEYQEDLRPPELIYGTLNTLVLLGSISPNQWAMRAARQENAGDTRIGLSICLLFAVAFLFLRAFELRYLNSSWDSNAYGSVVWLIMGLHTLHLLTDAVESAVLLALLFRKPFKGKIFSDVNDGCVYWYFVVVAWLPLYFLIHLAPRVH